jgi:acyl carrier protein
MSKKLYILIGRIMDVPVTDLNDNSSPETIPSWDSFNSYLLLDELESEFQTEFSIDEVVETKNIADIKKHLRNHGIILDD